MYSLLSVKPLTLAPGGPGKIDYDSSFFTILFTTSNKRGYMCVPTKMFTGKGQKWPYDVSHLADMLSHSLDTGERRSGYL